MIEMKLNRIKIDENRNEQVIVLKAADAEVFLPVVIGMPEVHAIKLRLSGLKPPRPLTHDLLNNIIRELGAQVRHVLIDKLENKTFYAKIVIETQEGKTLSVDARPSDSIALALRAEVPVYVDETILDEAGMKP